MKVVALVSGGKDSCYAMMKCVQYGHEIVALANLMPSNDSVDELDSYMYQTVGHQIVVSYAKCMGLPLFRRRIQGSTRHQKLGYKMTPGDEVEDMFILLSEIKRKIPSITAVSSGAISSDYQRLRVESVCSRIGLVSLAYLWKQDQAFLLQEMITNGIKAITVKVASLGLDPAKHLGKEISYLKPYLHQLEEKYGINICGEGGEYETLTLDCPLFLYAQILLDDFKVVLHSSDSIAPVGILHPLAFRLGNKKGFVSSSIDGVIDDGSISNDVDLEKMGSVCEVQGDCLKIYDPNPEPIQEVSVELTKNKVCMSRTKGENTFSMCCWLQNSCSTSTGLQEDLGLVLRKLELQLLDSGFGWEHVLYVHLYIADMNEFTLANETYVNFITEEKCHYGVPSRSTIELPLHCTGLGHAYVEVLVARDTSKRVLHVQSISSWAPSCIGPYSQATLQKEILHMAGQLGLEPSTMCLCKGGPLAEMDQALKNSEAVAKCFNCSISTSAIQFSIYCSTHVPLTTRIKIQERHEMFLDQRGCLQLEGSKSKVLKPISLFFLVPDLPKRAYVEVKPILYVEQDEEMTFEALAQYHSCTAEPSYWGFQPENWQDSCFQKCIVHGSICAVVINITNELALKIFSVSSSDNQKGGVFESLTTHGEMEIIARFCVYLLDKVLLENEFSWQDTVILRIYFPTRLGMHMETLYDIFSSAFIEFSNMSKRLAIDGSPIFSLVPVLGAGRSAAALDDLITCELFAQKAKGEFSV